MGGKNRRRCAPTTLEGKNEEFRKGRLQGLL